MSSDLIERADKLLKKQLMKGDFSYNYKLLSRQLQINVNDAKKIMYGFYQNNKDLLDVNYVIVGYIDTADKQSKLIKLTSNLEDKAAFNKIESIQIYSLTLKNIKINEVLIDINLKLREFEICKENLKTWGVINGPELICNETTTIPSRPSIIVRPSTNTKETNATKPKAEPSKPETKKEPDTGLISDLIRKRNPINPSNNTTTTKKQTQQTFGRSFTNNRTSPSAKPKTESHPRPKTESPVNYVEVIEDKDLNDEEYIKKKEQEKKEQERKRRDLESMFDDDDDDDFAEVVKDDPIEEIPKDEVEQVEPEKEIPQKRPIEDLDNIFDSSFSQTQSQKKQEPEQSKEESQEETKTSYYDEDGYLVTTVKKVAKPKTAKTTPKTTSTTTKSSESPTPVDKKAKTGPKQQSSLLNFFGKPKK